MAARNSCIGEVIGTWEILRDVGKNKQGAYLYECRCTVCKTRSIKTQGAIKASNGKGCQNCPPDYHFVIKGNVAIGTLSDGTEFLIDPEDVNLVASHYWHCKKNKGYIVSRQRRANKLALHRLIVGATDERIIVDHINRNKLDCRKSNLRIVTAQQNSMNASMRRNNTSGYIGVSYVTSRKIYRAQISLNNRDIRLGTSIDPMICAQMYNYAAKQLFREYTGQLNDVPKLSGTTKKQVEEKCRPYMTEAIVATQPCGHFLCNEGV